METNQDPSGATGATPVETSQESQQKEDLIPYGTYKKALSEKRNAMTKASELQAELDKLMSEREAAQKQELESQNKYKELWEAEVAKREKVETDFTSLNDEIMVGRKLNAFDKVLGSKLKNEDFYQFVDVGSIILDDNGNIEEESVKLAVENFRAKYGDTLLDAKEVKTVPNGQAGGANTSFSKDFSRMGKSEQKEALRGALKDFLR